MDGNSRAGDAGRVRIGRRLMILKLIQWMLRLGIAAAIFGGGVYGAYWLIVHQPHAVRKPAEELATLVDVIEAQSGDETVYIQQQGVVVPAREVEVRAQVSGKVIEQSSELIPGGRFRQGDVIARIEPDDYEFAVERAKSELERAKLALKEEQGRKTVAEREWKLLGGELQTDEAGRDLALRVPHIESARAAVNAAQSALDEAKLNLDRTVLRAPFNAFVKEEFIDPGQLVNSQTRVAVLAGSDECWVDAIVGLDDLPWIQFPERDGEGSPVRVAVNAGEYQLIREGRVLRLQGELDPNGRTPHVLIEVKDPLNLQPGAGDDAQPLLLDTFVRVEIEGKMAKDVFLLPETAARQNDQGGYNAWVMDSNQRLAIKPITVVRKRDQTWLVRGLASGDRVVNSRIGTPLPGMELRLKTPELESHLTQSDANDEVASASASAEEPS
ncbi:MAG: efflux RND transporter periplasmic adaptor subunit [bacterium]|nr:efflux RND transporter periplasmic adaptor subunit [bacterium]